MAINRINDGRDERGRLRTMVLRLGEMLGWSRQEVISFTETLTQRRWQHCRREEFEMVLEEYRSIGRVIQARATKRAERGAQDRLEERDRHAPFE